MPLSDPVLRWRVLSLLARSYSPTNPNHTSRYFVFFWLLAVVIVSNLIIAFILEAFFEKQGAVVKKKKKRKKQKSGGAFAAFIKSCLSAPDGEDEDERENEDDTEDQDGRGGDNDDGGKGRQDDDLAYSSIAMEDQHQPIDAAGSERRRSSDKTIARRVSNRSVGNGRTRPGDPLSSSESPHIEPPAAAAHRQEAATTTTTTTAAAAGEQQVSGYALPGGDNSAPPESDRGADTPPAALSDESIRRL